MNNLSLQQERLALVMMACKNIPINTNVHKRIAERVFNLFGLPDMIKEYTYKGKIHFRVVSIDCDHTRAEYIRHVDPTVQAYNEFFDDLYRDIEGPTHAHLLRPVDVDGFEPHTRDLALEAFEDGHAHNISEVRYESN